jgi:hypothetical protein
VIAFGDRYSNGITAAACFGNPKAHEPRKKRCHPGKRRHRLDRRLQFDLARAEKRREFECIVWCGVSGVGFVHTTTVHLPSHTKRSSSKAGFGFIETPEDQTLPELLAPPLREVLLKLDRMAGLNEKVKKALRVFKSFLGTIKIGNDYISMEIDPEVGTGDSGNLQADLTSLFVAVGEAAKARQRECKDLSVKVRTRHRTAALAADGA